MSKNSYGQYTPANTMLPVGRGETTPGVELCESIVPGIGKGILPAPWLPIQRYDKWIESGVVLSVGKPVGFEKNGFLVPAGITPGTTTIDYSSYDVAMKVIDVRTGLPITAAVDDVVIPSGIFGYSTVVPPVGISSYNIYQSLAGVTAVGTWGSDYTYYVDNDDPNTWRMHNTTKEDYVAFTCDYVVEIPWVGTTVPTGMTAMAKSYAYAYGAFTLGGFVKAGDYGVFIPSATRSDVGFMGQVLGFKDYYTPAGYALDRLDMVKSAVTSTAGVQYGSSVNMGTAWAMPGSATKGMPRAIHLATDGAFAAAKAAGDVPGVGTYRSVVINIQL